MGDGVAKTMLTSTEHIKNNNNLPEDHQLPAPPSQFEF